MEQTQRCENCQKDIPLAKVGTHYGYCKRNVIKCHLCGQMYDKNFQEDHEEEFHLTKECKHCRSKLHKKDEQRHSFICEMKPKACQYCEMDVPSAQFNTHLKTCEARTTQCELCSRPIINKQYAFHRSTCLGKKVNIGGYFRQQKKPDIKQLGLQDSLSQLHRKFNQENFTEKAFKRDKIDSKGEENRFLQKGSQGTRKQNKFLSKTQKKPQFTQQRQRSSQQVFRNFQEDFVYYPEENLDDFPSGFTSFYKHEFPKQFRRSSIYRNQFYPNDSIDNIEQISAQDQLLQEVLFQNRKKSRISLKNSSKYLPSDFLSEDIMNSSFYGKDILDIQKQKAIQRQFEQKNKKSKVARKK